MGSPRILATLADLDAEHALAAIAADSAYGAAIAHVNRVTAEHFSVPALGRVFAASVERVDLEPIEDRLAAVAEHAQVDGGWLLDLTRAPRRCMFDTSGVYARRVLASADRVAAYELHVQGLADLGIGVAA